MDHHLLSHRRPNIGKNRLIQVTNEEEDFNRNHISHQRKISTQVENNED
jgi:hypothetical protein